MQTLDPRPIFEPEGWYFISTTLTAAGRKKVQELYEYVNGDEYAANRSGGVYTVEQFIFDIEMNSEDQLLHPVCKMGGYFEELIEGVDYVLEFQCKEAFELATLAYRLNEMHEIFAAELDRIGA